MTSDRVHKWQGTNDIRNIKKGPYQTKQMKKDKYEDNKMNEQIKHKCMVIGCPNQWDFSKTHNTFCEKHQ